MPENGGRQSDNRLSVRLSNHFYWVYGLWEGAQLATNCTRCHGENAPEHAFRCALITAVASFAPSHRVPAALYVACSGLSPASWLLRAKRRDLRRSQLAGEAASRTLPHRRPCYRHQVNSCVLKSRLASSMIGRKRCSSSLRATRPALVLTFSAASTCPEAS